jgi:predicted dehydrogenase
LEHFSPIRVAVVGYGHWGPNYARVCTELDRVELVAICEPAASRRAAAKLRHPHVQVVSSLDEVLRMTIVDAVIIATPASTHRELSTAVIRGGRDLLVEKPLALRYEDCQAICDAAEKQHRILMTGHTFLFNSAIQWIKDHLTPEVTGQLHYLHTTRTNLGPVRKDTDAVWDLAPHDIAVFAYLLNMQPRWVSAAGTHRLHSDRADVAFLTLGYANGLVGHIHVSWLDPSKVREMVLVGSHERIVFNDLDTLEPVRVFHKGIGPEANDSDAFGEFQLQVRDGDIVSPRIAVGEPLKNQCQHFFDCIRNRSRPRSDGEFGAKVVQVLEAASISLRRQGAPVEVGQMPVA